MKTSTAGYLLVGILGLGAAVAVYALWRSDPQDKIVVLSEEDYYQGCMVTFVEPAMQGLGCSTGCKAAAFDAHDNPIVALEGVGADGSILELSTYCAHIQEMTAACTLRVAEGYPDLGCSHLQEMRAACSAAGNHACATLVGNACSKVSSIRVQCPYVRKALGG